MSESEPDDSEVFFGADPDQDADEEVRYGQDPAELRRRLDWGVRGIPDIGSDGSSSGGDDMMMEFEEQSEEHQEAAPGAGTSAAHARASAPQPLLQMGPDARSEARLLHKARRKRKRPRKDDEGDGEKGGGKKRNKNDLDEEGSRRMGLANSYFVEGEYAKAIAELKECIRTNPTCPDPYVTLGTIHGAMKDLQNQCNSYWVAAELSKKDASAWGRAFEAAREVNDVRLLAVCAENYLRLNPSDVDAKIVYLGMLADSDEPSKAVKGLQAILRSHPDNKEVKQILTKAYLRDARSKQHGFHKAIEVLQSSLPADGNMRNAELSDIYNLSEVYTESGDHNANIEFIEQCQRGKVGLTMEILGRYAISLIHSERVADARPHVAELMKKNPEEWADLQIDCGDAYFEEGMFEQALDLYLRAKQSAAQDKPRLWMKLARCHAELASFDTAIAMYRDIIRMKPDGALAVSELSTTLRDLHRNTEARDIVDQYLEHIGYIPGVNEASVDTRVLVEHAYLLYADPARLDDFVTVVEPMFESIEPNRRGRRRRNQNNDDSFLESGDELGESGLREGPAGGGQSVLLGSKREPVSLPPKVDLNLRERLNNDDLYVDLCLTFCQALMKKDQDERAELISSEVMKLLPNHSQSGRMKVLLMLMTLQKDGAQINALNSIKMLCQSFPGCNAVWSLFNHVTSQSPELYMQQKNYVEKCLLKALKDDLEDMGLVNPKITGIVAPSTLACFPMNMMAGHIYAMSENYERALRHYLSAYNACSSNPFVSLCLGIAFLRVAGSSHGKSNRFKKAPAPQDSNMTRGFAFIVQYHKLENYSVVSAYNVARALHDVGLRTPAVTYYKCVLESPSQLHPELRLHAAHNLAQLYRSSGAVGLAEATLKKHIVV